MISVIYGRDNQDATFKWTTNEISRLLWFGFYTRLFCVILLISGELVVIMYARKASHVPAAPWIKKRNHVIKNVCESCLERVFPAKQYFTVLEINGRSFLD